LSSSFGASWRDRAIARSTSAATVGPCTGGPRQRLVLVDRIDEPHPPVVAGQRVAAALHRLVDHPAEAELVLEDLSHRGEPTRVAARQTSGTRIREPDMIA
jgi:hypothetical protein